jgi:hypothetical protein
VENWPDANSWIADSNALLNDLVTLSAKFDEVMMRGPSTPRTYKMVQVERNWADFSATARTFSQRLRAAQTVVRFPVDANAIAGVADTVDGLNYGAARWQTTTDEPDRERKSMEFKELYLEPYVTCHHILLDAISTFREYLNLKGIANPEASENEQRHMGDQARGLKAAELDARFGDDFRSVCWFGTDYSFTPNQAGVVKVLWNAWQSRTPEVSDTTLLDASGGDGRRIRDVFRGTGNKMHPAWDTMIQRGRRDTLKLVEPEIPDIPT